MTFPAKVVPQLSGNDGLWRPYDCWVASARGLISFASNGKVRIDAETARKRSGKWAGNPSHATLERLGPGNFPDMLAIIRHPDTVAEFKKAGLKPPKVRVLGITRAATVFSYLEKGYQAAVAIKYATLRELRPKTAGSTTFGGGHSVRWYGWLGIDGKPAKGAPFFTDQLDPLCDGRRPGIARGPQRVNRRTLLAEAGDVELHDANGRVTGHVGKGKVLALVVKPAEPLHDPGPSDPTPTDTPCEESLASEQAETDRLRAVIRTIGTALTDAQAPLNQIVVLVNDPANTGGVDA